jgi:hypothetical protein
MVCSVLRLWQVCVRCPVSYWQSVSLHLCALFHQLKHGQCDCVSRLLGGLEDNIKMYHGYGDSYGSG